MDNWHGKHPIPWDFFYSFNEASGQNLNWFWNNWFFTYNYLDLAIDKADGNNVLIRNIGGFAIPFDLVITYADGTTTRMHQTPAVWRADQSKTTIPLPNAGKTVRSIQVDTGIYVDADASNNKWTA